MTRLLTRLAPVAAAALALLAASPGEARSPGPVQGVWQGASSDASRGVATVYVNGDSLVLMDDSGIVVTSATWRHHGPGTKDGRMTLHVDLAVSGRFLPSGGPAPKARRASAKWLGSAVVGDDAARLCVAETALEKARPGFRSDVSVPGPTQLRCYDLTRVADAGKAMPRRVPPQLTPPDGNAPNPPPTILPTARECMSECRQHSMMRAVSAEQIDADCRRTCGVETKAP